MPHALLVLASVVAQLEGLPDEVRREAVSAGSLPGATYIQVAAWEAESAPHNTGSRVEDGAAIGDAALEAVPGVDEPGVLLFGPYIELEPGDYVAFFRVMLLDSAEDDTAGQLDACVSYGLEVLATGELVGNHLSPGRYARVPLGFRYEGGRLECRLVWSGVYHLRVDNVTLFRVEGSSAGESIWRAPQPVPSGEPRDISCVEELRPFPDVFPRSAEPAEELVVCDLRRARADMRLLVYSLQGLVNRSRPRLYCVSVGTDEQWLEHMVERGWVQGTTEVEDPADLLRMFADAYRGCVVTDSDMPVTRNIATMLASVRDAVVASPRLARDLGLPIVEDLRGRWSLDVDAYRWAFDTLWSELNHHVVACLWPDHLALRDYLVQHRVFVFWVPGPLDGVRPSASPDAEVRLVEELLARMPANIPVMGYPWAGKDVGIGEGPGVTLFAEFGKYLVGSIDCGNLSVHSGVEVGELRQRPAPAPPPLEDKVYVTFVMSDGDNLPVLTTSNFPQLWADPTRGRYPIAWTLSPSATLLIPGIVDYYYSTATPADHFIGAVSGVGYTYPDSYGARFRDGDRQRVYDAFLDQTAEYMARADLRGIWIMGATERGAISRYAERVPLVDGIYPDYGRRVVSGEDATYPTAQNVPVFHAVTGWRLDTTREERIEELVADVVRMTPAERPAFLHAFILNWLADLPMMEEVLERLGPDYVAVRPDHLASLWREDMARRQVLVRLPSTGVAVEGHPLRLRGSVRNVSDGPIEVAIRLVEGIGGGHLTPAQAALAPGEEVPLVQTGLPSGDRIRLLLTGGFGERTAERRLRLIAEPELGRAIPEGVVLVPRGYLEAEDLLHRGGVRRQDSSASGGAYWAATAGETEPGFIMFGPYTTLEQGKYMALFCLKRTSDGVGPLVALDAAVQAVNQIGRLDLGAEELPLDKWRWYPVVFDHPGGSYETRVFWLGSASLAVDAVALFALE